MRQPMSEDELMHFGIKGMHWGQRRYQNEDGSLTPAGEARYGKKPGFLTRRKNKKKMAKVRAAKQTKQNKNWENESYSKIKNLSDKDLKARIDRLNDEKRYKDLMDQTRNAGQKFVQDILKDAGKKVATAALIKVGNHYVNKFLDKKVFKTTTKNVSKGVTNNVKKDITNNVKKDVKKNSETITPEMKKLAAAMMSSGKKKKK